MSYLTSDIAERIKACLSQQKVSIPDGALAGLAAVFTEWAGGPRDVAASAGLGGADGNAMADEAAPTQSDHTLKEWHIHGEISHPGIVLVRAETAEAAMARADKGHFDGIVDEQNALPVLGFIPDGHPPVLQEPRRPIAGERAYPPGPLGGASIEIDRVLSDPEVETLGCFSIIDRKGRPHIVQLSGGDWLEVARS